MGAAKDEACDAETYCVSLLCGLAAFFGQTKSVEVLLQRGADPNLRNKDGALPAQAMMANRAVTEWVARDILKIPMDWAKIREGRRQATKLLSPGSALPSNGRNSNWFVRNYFMFGQFCTHHLWFLYDLVYPPWASFCLPGY